MLLRILPPSVRFRPNFVPKSRIRTRYFHRTFRLTHKFSVTYAMPTVRIALCTYSPGILSRGEGMASFWQDLRFAFRALGKSPWFAAIAIVTLALGIAVNPSIFSIINRFLLRPIPVTQSEQR